MAHLGVVESDELVAEGADFTVHDETLEVTGYVLENVIRSSMARKLTYEQRASR